MLEEEQEYVALVTELLPYGVEVEVDGVVGFIDQAKLPAWWSGGAPSTRGEQLRVVVLDSSRTPPRLSALDEDVRIARERRSSG